MNKNTQHYLRHHQPALLEKVQNHTLSTITIDSEDGNSRVLGIINDQLIQLESNVDPIGLGKYMFSDMDKSYQHILFIGGCTGKHIESGSNLNSDARFDVVLINLDDASLFFKSVDMSKKIWRKLNTIYLIETDEHVSLVIYEIFKHITEKTFFHFYPAYRILFSDRIKLIVNAISETTKARKQSLTTNQAYENKWVLNSMVNFSTTVRTPNIFHNVDVFKHMNVVLVAAGPSLSFEIENLKKIIEDKSAFVVAVGSAINALLAENVLPDAVCTYDPSHLNINVYKNMIEKGVETVPMLFGSSVADDVVRGYKGPKFHFLTGQDSISSLLLEGQYDANMIIPDAQVITILAFRIFARLGAKNIYFVGQNFSFLNEQWYAEGINYEHFPTNTQDMSKYKTLPSVDGKQVHTFDSFISAKKHLELAIIQEEYTNVYNTTKGGAVIEGANYVALSSVMGSFEQESIPRDWYDKLRNNYKYEDILLRVEAFKQAYLSYRDQLDDMRKQVVLLSGAIETRDEKKILNAYNEFDTVLKIIEKNNFYIQVIRLMVRNKLDILLQRVASANKLKTNYERLIYLGPHYEQYVADLIISTERYKILFDLFLMNSLKVLE